MTINNRFMEVQQTLEVSTRVVGADQTERVNTADVMREHLMEVFVNERPVLRLVCTPNRLAELALGRCVTEGFISCREDVESLSVCESGSRARIYLRQGLELAVRENEPQTETTCCTDNKLLGTFHAVNALKPLARAVYSKEDIFALIQKFHENTLLHKKTKGTHSCYLSCKGIYQGVFEDIGRHNALDKAIGYAFIKDLDYKDCILFTTGRVPVDMVRKVIMANVPVLVSKAVPTAEAAEMARRYHLTLICRAWPDSYEVYNEA